MGNNADDVVDDTTDNVNTNAMTTRAMDATSVTRATGGG
jgi:hypothetical protein